MEDEVCVSESKDAEQAHWGMGQVARYVIGRAVVGPRDISGQAVDK